MAKVLVDTGPLLPWFDRRDGDHAKVLASFSRFKGQLLTNWPVNLADASLVWPAGRLGLAEVITLDAADFDIYRLPGGKRLANLLQ